MFTIHSGRTYTVVPFKVNVVSAYMFNFTATAREPCPATVSRSNGNVIVGVDLSLFEPTQNLTYTSTTDVDGAAHFINIKSGNYRIVATKDGYGTYTSALTIEDDSQLELLLTPNGNFSSNFQI